MLKHAGAVVKLNHGLAHPALVHRLEERDGEGALRILQRDVDVRVDEGSVLNGPLFERAACLGDLLELGFSDVEPDEAGSPTTLPSRGLSGLSGAGIPRCGVLRNRWLRRWVLWGAGSLAGDARQNQET